MYEEENVEQQERDIKVRDGVKMQENGAAKHVILEDIDPLLGVAARDAEVG